MVLYLSDDLSLEITSELGDSLEVVVEKDLMEAIKRMAVLVKKNSHLNFLKETVLGDKEQGVWIRDKGKGEGIGDQGQGIRPKWSLTLKTKSC